MKNWEKKRKILIIGKGFMVFHLFCMINGIFIIQIFPEL